ncbi:DUF2272 domain-containing protein [Methylococcus geothermalis]|uniref:DUF2272 domain-containing protein n=1 Tax=Methylococcus geothermalis TaxID=2681310 RepID=A0A858QCD7_9GAMM|nr:DUF2272 domain-containing protein [Methylococcus geothermalis]
MPTQPVQPAGPVSSAEKPAAKEPTLTAIKRRILSLANAEWEFFGSQRVIYDGGQESIPHVGYWEDEDESHIQRVSYYWQAVNKPGLSGLNCSQPWSAAFVSWVMEMAGVPESQFPPASAHWVYLSQIIRKSDGRYSAFVPHSIKEYSPRPGDLICASRERYGLPSVTRPLETYMLEDTKLHCDIVVERNDGSVDAIGGNVRNSVSRSTVALNKDGLLQPTRQRPWFLVLENRL